MVAVWRGARLPPWVGLWPVSAVRRTPGVGSGHRPRQRSGRRTILGVPEAPGTISSTPAGPRMVNRRTIGLRNGSQRILQPAWFKDYPTHLGRCGFQSGYLQRHTAFKRLMVTFCITFVADCHNNHIRFPHHFICDERMKATPRRC